MAKKSKKWRVAEAYHDRAMLYAGKADVHVREKRLPAATRCYATAFKAERLAATQVKEEPSRSILFRSAGWLAFKSGDKREAERMACFGLAGNPPEEFARELRELLAECLVAEPMAFAVMTPKTDGFDLCAHIEEAQDVAARLHEQQGDDAAPPFEIVPLYRKPVAR
jgi:hypothetical protein